MTELVLRLTINTVPVVTDATIGRYPTAITRTESRHVGAMWDRHVGSMRYWQARQFNV